MIISYQIGFFLNPEYINHVVPEIEIKHSVSTFKPISRSLKVIPKNKSFKRHDRSRKVRTTS